MDAILSQGVSAPSAADSDPQTDTEPQTQPDEPARAKRVRKRPDTRRAEIVTTARQIFAETGYAEAGLADVAAAANVSKALVYHYFPQGRPELFANVLQELLAQFQERLRQAAKVPFSPRTRMEHLLGALFAFFDENPAAYRLLFRDPWVTHDEAVEASAIATRVQIASELAAVMAGSGGAGSADDLVAASTGLLGFALANVELCLAGQLEPETAWRVTCMYALSQFPD
jgi:AcrR family transcriptional regulator